MSSEVVSHPVLVPRDTVNDDVVTIVKWERATGDRVEAGSPLFEVETSKALIAVDAEHSGYVEILKGRGEKVEVGSRVAVIHAAPLSAGVAAASAPLATGASAPGSPAGSVGSVPTVAGPTISRRAAELIEEHGLDPALFDGLELVREADVLRAIENRVEEPIERRVERAGPRNVAAEFPVAIPRRPPKGGIWAQVRGAASDRGEGLFRLLWRYWFNTYFLGFLARIAPYGAIVWVHRWRGVRIGRDCFIDQTAVLETAYPENIWIGDDVRVTLRAIVMTHIKGPDYLRETGLVPRAIRPVRLESHCFIGVGAIILPGVTVGRASVVASGAVVVNDVPPFTMVAGNPARVVKRYPQPSEPPSRA